MRRISLKVLIAAAISVVSLLLTIAVSYVIGHDAVSRLEQEIGQSLALLADEMQDKLDRAMFERLQSLDNMAALGRILQKADSPESLRTSLERFQSAYSDYSCDRIRRYRREDPERDQRRIRTAQRQGPSLVQGGLEASLRRRRQAAERKLCPSNSPRRQRRRISSISPFRVGRQIDIRRAGATLSADWAEEVRDTLLGSMKDAIPADVIVLNEARQVLFGPDDITGKVLDLPSIRAARRGNAGFAVESCRTVDRTLRAFRKATATALITA